MATAAATIVGAASSAPAESPPSQDAPEASKAPTFAQQAGRRMIYAFDGLEAPVDLLRRIRRGEAAGVILFSRNIETRQQARKMTARLQRWVPEGDPPLLVTIDQEGGIVKRLAGAPRRSAFELGQLGDEELARKEGRNTAHNLLDVGVNVDLAPVVDIGRKGRIMRAQRRAYSSSPERVARIAGAFAAGLREGGVVACTKHFPGLGDAREDQDRVLNTIHLSAETLRSVDYLPFERLSDAGVEMVMLSTALYPALDPDRPAVFSKQVLGEELRDRVGFEGVTITDSLGTVSATRFGTPERRAYRAARAGNDLLLFAGGYAAGVRAQSELAAALADGRLKPGPSAASLARIDALRRTLADD